MCTKMKIKTRQSSVTVFMSSRHELCADFLNIYCVFVCVCVGGLASVNKGANECFDSVSFLWGCGGVV